MASSQFTNGRQLATLSGGSKVNVAGNEPLEGCTGRPPRSFVSRDRTASVRQRRANLCSMRDFDELVREAESAPIGGWDFSWLDGRAIEERPTWHYFDRVAERAARVGTLLEVQAGTGSMIASLPTLPSLAAATEGFPPSVTIAAPRLRARGIHLVVTSQATAGL